MRAFLSRNAAGAFSDRRDFRAGRSIKMERFFRRFLGVVREFRPGTCARPHLNHHCVDTLAIVSPRFGGCPACALHSFSRWRYCVASTACGMRPHSPLNTGSV